MTSTILTGIENQVLWIVLVALAACALGAIKLLMDQLMPDESAEDETDQDALQQARDDLTDRLAKPKHDAVLNFSEHNERVRLEAAMHTHRADRIH